MKLDLKIGELYSQKEIAEKMGIKPNSFSKNREKYQEHLLNFCDFKVDYSGLSNKYLINKVFDIDYFKCPSKRNKNMKAITEALYEENCKQPISTAARGSRKIKNKPTIKVLNLADGTRDVYCRIATVEMYGKRDGSDKKGTHGWIDHEVLVYLDKTIDEYVLLTEDQIQEYFNYIADERSDNVTTATQAFDRFVSNPSHTKEEKEKFDALLSNLDSSAFINAKMRFKEKYGGVPFWACYYKHFDKE